MNVTLGNTGITVDKNAFGALPIQRITKKEASVLLRKAYDCGIRFFDTARAYSDSEEKIGYALADVRKEIYIATKTMATSAEKMREDLETSLRLLQTDYIDIYQFHNPSFCPKPGDESGLYDEALKAKKEGKIRHIGITNHSLAVAKEAVESGLYETLQFPFSYLSGEQELELIQLCKEHHMGFIAMKGMSGGLITSGTAAYYFMKRYDQVLPIWGVQSEKELDEFLFAEETLKESGRAEALERIIEKDRQELAGNFCRSCGYCMPCPVGIQINNCARMSLLLGRAVVSNFTTSYWQTEMERIEQCLHCNQCVDRCPYHLNTPQLLQTNLKFYRNFIREHHLEKI